MIRKENPRLSTAANLAQNSHKKYKRKHGDEDDMRKVVVTAALAAICSGTAYAGSIERACLQSNRPGVSVSLCGCIQAVANRTLTNRDQRLAATFFSDPHKAQVIRQSDNAAHEVFWRKYKTFGATAESYCS